MLVVVPLLTIKKKKREIMWRWRRCERGVMIEGGMCKNMKDVRRHLLPRHDSAFHLSNRHTHTHTDNPQRQVYRWSWISSRLRRRDIHHVIKGESCKVSESPAADFLTSDKSNLNHQISTDAIAELDDKAPMRLRAQAARCWSTISFSHKVHEIIFFHTTIKEKGDKKYITFDLCF